MPANVLTRYEVFFTIARCRDFREFLSEDREHAEEQLLNDEPDAEEVVTLENERWFFDNTSCRWYPEHEVTTGIPS